MKLKSHIENSNHEHALLSPSASKKWMLCPASLACEVGIPNESGQAATNGVAMHTMSERVLLRLIKGEEASAKTLKGSHVLNHGKGPIKALVKPVTGAVLITDDFVSQVDKYVDYCRPIIDAAEVVEVEQRVNLTRVLHPGVEIEAWDSEGNKIKGELVALQTFGTADLVAVMPTSDGSYMLIVGDLKTGRHRVEAKENYQMMLYALGLLKVYQRIYDISAVRLVIFQPYAGGADEWDTTPEALREFGTSASKAALKAIDAFQRGKTGLKPADFNPGAAQCQWCRFSEKCNAKRKVATRDIVDDLADDSPTEMSLDHLKAEWDKLPLMRQHIADIEKAMYAALMRGEKVEGLKLVEGRKGNMAWLDESKLEYFKENHVNGYLLDKLVTVTPTEAQKKISVQDPELWAQLEPLVVRKPGQPLITTADDKRPAWSALSDDDLSN